MLYMGPSSECTPNPCLQARLHRCDEVKSLIQRLVLLGVAGDSEGTCEKIVVEMGSLRSTLQTSLDVVRRGFEGADDVTRKCAKVRRQTISRTLFEVSSHAL